MKTLFLVLAFVTLIGGSLAAKADEHHDWDHDHYDYDHWDHHDHYWNDRYWHEHQYGFWHGYPGYWSYRHHSHVFIQIGPLTIAH
ncbi:MAG TPA: hypothetical protein VE860_11955 [Chthoniobacterales bacterium]|nr:hypothetical protein [Chthoniobacterales bacterium]